ncbi:MAG: TrkH family potassium uptake protein [Bacillota bacterium]
MITNLRNRIRFSPTQVLVLGFAALILTGAFLLTLPIASTGAPISFLNALFTATSAVCVTGLVVVDTGTAYTLFGQVVVILLIQFGGLGIMTMATLMFLLLGKRISLKERLVMQEALNQFSLQGLVRLTKNIIMMTLLIEGIGAILLATRFVPFYGWKRGLWFSVFHAISSFCNAGFDLIGGFRSLVPFVEDPVITLTVAFLIIFGGLGFTVIADIWRNRKWSSLSLHSKIALITTAALLIFGTLAFYVLELNNPETLAPLSPGAKVWASFFQAVTPRTAGYNTLPLAAMGRASIFLTIILMFVGASPCSTGGGIKTTTFTALLLAIKAAVTGDDDITVFRRRLPSDLVLRAMTITAIALLLVVVVTMGLSITEPGADFLALLYETTSAFGTVGLTLGVTPALTILGKIMIILTMFAGRVGPMTIGLALGKKAHAQRIRYPEDKIMVG